MKDFIFSLDCLVVHVVVEYTLPSLIPVEICVLVLYAEDHHNMIRYAL